MNSLTTGAWGSFFAPCSRALGGKSGMTRAAPLVCFALYRQRQPQQTTALTLERSRLPQRPLRAPDFRPPLLALILLLILLAPWTCRVAPVMPEGKQVGLWADAENGCERAGSGAREGRARGCAARSLTSL